MTLARFVNWSSICLLVGVAILVAWSYLIARDQGRLPASHPWPAVSLVGSSAAIGFLGLAKQSRTLLLVRFVVVVLLALGALFYLRSLMSLI